MEILDPVGLAEPVPPGTPVAMPSLVDPVGSITPVEQILWGPAIQLISLVVRDSR